MQILSKIARMIRRPAPRPPSPTAALAAALVNPLRGLSINEAQYIVDSSRGGDYSQLQRIYREIERADPTLKVCVARRKGAMSAFELKAASGKVPQNSEQLAADQEAAIRSHILCARNLSRAMEHLELAAFRGYSHIVPCHGADGAVTEFELVDSWNLSRNGDKGEWLWNPESKSGIAGLEIIPDGETVWVEDDAIDYPALIMYIAKALGVRDWGRFVERFGIPPRAIIMPQFATPEDRAAFLAAAKAERLGSDAVYPNGTTMSWASEARGIEPFSAMIRYMQEQVVLMATGGLLTSLAVSGSGTLAGGAHEDTWQQVTARSRRINAEALNAALAVPLLSRIFPGQPILAKIEYADEPKPLPSEVLDDAIKAKAAGYQFTLDELNRLTGYNLEKAPDPPPSDPFGGYGRFANSKKADSGAGNTRENARSGADGKEEGSNARTRHAAVLRDLAKSFTADMQPAARAVAKLLALPEAEQAAAAAKLLDELPGLIPDDPQMAAVLEEEIAKAFTAAARVQNENPNRAPDGQFASEGGDQTGGKSGKQEKSTRRKANAAAGAKNMADLEAGKDSPNFMRSAKLGNIAFYQGGSDEGYAHIKSNLSESHQVMLRDNNIPNTLAHGKYYEDTYRRQSGHAVVDHKTGNLVFLGKNGGKGVKIITAYRSKEKAAAFLGRSAIENAKGDGT